MSREYWACIVDEVIPDAGVALTKEQRDEILDNILAHASMEGEVTGRNIWDANLSASKQREVDDARKALRHEEASAWKLQRSRHDHHIRWHHAVYESVQRVRWEWPGASDQGESTNVQQVASR